MNMGYTICHSIIEIKLYIIGMVIITTMRMIIEDLCARGMYQGHGQVITFPSV